jgi:RHS repeat-associated protein
VEYSGSGTSSRTWLLADERGSITARTDSTGAATAINSYDEYGNPDASNIGRFGYTGQIWLADAGVWHYKARAYHPGLGRFMQTDPIGQAGGMNIYAYVGGDPVNFTDPTGLLAAGPCDGKPSCSIITGSRPERFDRNLMPWDTIWYYLQMIYKPGAYVGSVDGSGGGGGGFAGMVSRLASKIASEWCEAQREGIQAGGASFISVQGVAVGSDGDGGPITGGRIDIGIAYDFRNRTVQGYWSGGGTLSPEGSPNVSGHQVGVGVNAGGAESASFLWAPAWAYDLDAAAVSVSGASNDNPFSGQGGDTALRQGSAGVGLGFGGSNIFTQGAATPPLGVGWLQDGVADMANCSASK